ncbi:hypothetical protein BDZ90DRAFT_279681 [Jaminaea rosea]|uniref:Rad21/Rec8-like protein N-terminal domain-containing protein n=1 Tax=Jaminaea rosea TaxID=1569628 RepID=A0A316UPW3_9BASI|nr:hypothetical protein BDZ90DRAFT_279681 [Jaminaea rosea]PWN27320.1 hypothetical protein BDZ90DRAFT_279681 [Jaminaea rosea]
MFYSQQMLAKRTGLGIVWLAATLGNRSTALKKITRRELDGINISKACDSVASPSEPMALRLSSQLMYGVVRLYSQKSEQFVLDVSQVHATMRKNLSEITAPSAMFIAGDQIDMVASKKGASHGAGSDGQVTLKPNQAFYVGDFDSTFDLSWENFLDQRLARSASAAPGDDTASGISSGRFVSRSPGASLGRPPPHTATRDAILLPSHRGGDYSSDTGDAGAGRGGADFGGANDLDFGLDDLLGQGDDLPLNLGLPGFDPPAAPPDGARPPGAARLSADGGPPPLDDGAADHPMDGFDPLDMGLEDAGALQGILHRSHSPSLADDGDAPSPSKRQKITKKKKVSFSVEDPRISLSEEAVRDQEGDYARIMAEQYAEKEERDAVKRAEGWVHNLLHNAPADLANGPLLVDFWQVTVGAENERVDVMMREHRGRGLVGVGDQGEQAEGVGAAAGGVLAGFGDDGWQLDLGGGDYPIDEIARDGSAEVGRGQGTPSMSGRAVLPWMAQDTTAAGAGDTTDLLRAGQGTPGGGHRSMSTSSAGGREALGLLGLAGGSPHDFLDMGGGGDQSSSAHVSVVESVPQAQRDLETTNFFGWAQRRALEVAPNALTFADIASTADSTRQVAAAAFAHVLQLTTNGNMAVKQVEGYGEIIIEILVQAQEGDLEGEGEDEGEGEEVQPEEMGAE